MHEPFSSITGRPRVLMLAYACSPYRGSEYCVGWGRAIESARCYDTWVLCGPESEADLRRFIAEEGVPPGLHFEFPALAQRWQRLPKLYAHNYLAIRQWHRAAYRHALRLHEDLPFALVHHVNITGFREPGELWRLPVPFIWGPVSGTQNLPHRFLPTLGWRDACKEAMRSLINAIQLNGSRRVSRAVREAVTVLAANTQIQREFARAQGVQPALLLETGLAAVQSVAAPKSHAGQPLRLLWSGELKAFKGLHLLLEALAQLPSSVRFELRILGQGPMRARWQAQAERLGIAEHCYWQGFVPYAEVLRQYDEADVFLFTSLRDTSGNVMLEALSRGVPVIALAHQGAADIVTSECGVRVPVTTPIEVVAGLRDALVSLAEDRQRLTVLSDGALTRARYYLWSNNGARMQQIYQQVLAKAEADQRDLYAPEGGSSHVLHA